ncbi:MAG: T9SS type A sorting domain-containing protein [Ignavibacteria bacterium]|nr:T9SS type A sorting domain-containing protein [Ignavibacteria bacterium]
MNNLKFFFAVLLIIISNDLLSQSMYEFDCSVSHSAGTNDSIDSPFGGRVKPNRTDLSGGQTAPEDSYFPVLVVFIQFKNEDNDPRNSWLSNQAPTYLANIIATSKNTVGDWWNWYDPQTEILSSHWAEISRGKFHVISPVPDTVSNGAFAVNLSKTGQEYFEFYNYDKYKTDSAIHREIWDSIKAQGLTDWRPYDRWRKIGNLFYFTPFGEGDKIVDMIYQVFKTRGGANVIDSNNVSTTLFYDYAGYNHLGSHYNNTDIVDTFETKIDYGSSHEGSGVTISFRGQLAQYIGTMGHEHGHQTFSGGHSTYSRVSFGLGYDFFYSPADMILNEYMTSTDAIINSINYLGDYSSRNSGSGNLLKVPIQGNEYFLLASRNKYSKWDRVMTGDTAQIDPYNDNSDYGKGLYIYHIPNGLNFPGGDISQQDMECADGLFEWEYAGQAAQQVVHDCFISGATVWPHYKKKKVIYENDSSNLFRNCISSNYTPRPIGDGISFRYYQGCDQYYRPILHYKWWGVGDQPANSCNIGTDRHFTNDEEIYTRFDIGGDREDPWFPGYNEVFSPYSSPNTKTWAGNYSGIYIWYNTYSGSTPGEVAGIKIYKAGEGGYTDSSILQITPPSKPMGLVVDYHLETENIMRLILTWNHNMEPDMLDTSNNKKKYKIWRATSTGMSVVPTDYTLHNIVEIDSGTAPSYIDTTIYAVGSGWPGMGNTIEYPVRYKIQAIDIYQDSSVRSDFGKGVGIYITDGCADCEEEDPGDSYNLNQSVEIPKDFKLYGNYPNPFNPSTNIKFDLPKDVQVSIKIYDIVGREVKTLVNEYRTAGRYSVIFSGADFASGVYYYKIKAGEFEQVRKMILLK